MVPLGPSTWVLLRGLTRGKNHWADFPGQLQKALPGVSVVVLDVPGNGDLFRQQSPSSIESMVRNLRSQLEATGVVKPIGIFSVSLGGMIATHWAMQWPEEVTHLVMVNSSLRGVSPFYFRLRPMSYFGLLGSLLCTGFPRVQERIILKLTSNHAGRDVLDDWVDIRGRTPVSAGNALRQLVAAARYRPRMHTPAAKTLILASRHDQLVSVQCSLAIAKLWSAGVKVHPTAGHDLTLDDGDWVTREVCRFLDS